MDDACNKRRRPSTPPTSAEGPALPLSLMVEVASYLPKIPRVIFAVAMSNASQQRSFEIIESEGRWQLIGNEEASTRGNDSCEAILSSLTSEECKVLDFGDLDKSLASKLSDEDISAILVAMDARARLRVLTLAGVSNITGRGLERLRSSPCLMKLDLSTVGLHESPALGVDSKISEDAVLPILHEHMNIQSPHSLICIRFPQAWNKQESSEYKKFISRYNRSSVKGNKITPPYRRTAFYCKNCANCEEDITHPYGKVFNQVHPRIGWVGFWATSNGQQIRNVCYMCMNTFCEQDDVDNHYYGRCYSDGLSLKHCANCLNKFCNDCVSFEKCEKCSNPRDEKLICSGCGGASKCKKRNKKFGACCAPINTCACWEYSYCSSCAPVTSNCKNDECHNESCDLCSRADPDSESVCTVCTQCKVELCAGCRLPECKKDLEHACSGCLRLCAPAVIHNLLEEKDADKKQILELLSEIKLLQLQRTVKDTDSPHE